MTDIPISVSNFGSNGRSPVAKQGAIHINCWLDTYEWSRRIDAVDAGKSAIGGKCGAEQGSIYPQDMMFSMRNPTRAAVNRGAEPHVFASFNGIGMAGQTQEALNNAVQFEGVAVAAGAPMPENPRQRPGISLAAQIGGTCNISPKIDTEIQPNDLLIWVAPDPNASIETQYDNVGKLSHRRRVPVQVRTWNPLRDVISVRNINNAVHDAESGSRSMYSSSFDVPSLVIQGSAKVFQGLLKAFMVATRATRRDMSEEQLTNLAGELGLLEDGNGSGAGASPNAWRNQIRAALFPTTDEERNAVMPAEYSGVGKAAWKAPEGRGSRALYNAVRTALPDLMFGVSHVQKHMQSHVFGRALTGMKPGQGTVDIMLTAPFVITA